MQRKFRIQQNQGEFRVRELRIEGGSGPESQIGGTNGFQRWEKGQYSIHSVEEYFLDLGASQEALDKARADIEAEGTATLLIQR